MYFFNHFNMQLLCRNNYDVLIETMQETFDS